VINVLTRLPASIKGGAAVAVGGGFLWGVGSLLGMRGLAIFLGGVALVALCLMGYRFLLKRGQKKRADRMGQEIKEGFSQTPQGINRAEMIARLDELRSRFEEGMKTFQTAGKNIYSLPWFVMVGEPGGGKTEAIRHSNMGFPPGLHDELQGVGGTINMNWWFTNHGVILDTAGRLMFEEVETAKSTEWKEFLKLLRKARTACPINGMVLVIPVESLIRDSAEEIEKKGAKIAQQFDTIQRALNIRFPVTVLITKCDLINGFREFFDGLRDPQLQHQMLGWSNPAPIDQPFQPDQVSQHLEAVRQHLIKYRQLLLNRAETASDKSARPLDATDALYDFPHSFARIMPRLKRYLQIIFAAGEWSAKPLFLRGIYFTSSMREGSTLDAELAEALGVSVESLPEGRVWEKDRAYFLRDVWMEKIFREKGLVTRSGNTSFLLWRRKAILLSAGFLSVALLFLLTWLGGESLKENVVRERDLWAAAAKQGWVTGEDGLPTWFPLVYRNVNGDYVYGVDERIKVGRTKIRMGEFFDRLSDKAGRPFQIPAVFQISDQLLRLARDEGNLQARRQEALLTLFESSVLRPLLHAARERMKDETIEKWSKEAKEAKSALEQLIRLEACAASPGGVDVSDRKGEKAPLDLDKLFRYVLGDDENGYIEYNEHDRNKLDQALARLYGDHQVRLESLSDGSDLSGNEPIRHGVDTYIEHCLLPLKELGWFEQSLNDTRTGSEKGAEDAEKWFSVQKAGNPNDITDYSGYDTWRRGWDTKFGSLEEGLDRFRKESGELEERYQQILLLNQMTIADIFNQAQDCLDELTLPEMNDTEGTIVSEISEELHNKQQSWQEALGKDKATITKVLDSFAEMTDTLAKLVQRFSIYVAADTFLNQTEPDVSEQENLGDKLEALEESCKGEKEKIDRYPAADDPAAELSKKVCDLACRFRRYQMVKAVLDDLLERDENIAVRVARIADRLDPQRLPTIPLTSWSEETFKNSYDPEAVESVFKDLMAVDEVLGEPEPNLLDADYLRGQLTSAGEPYRQYAAKFRNYWINLMNSEFVVDLKWKEAHDELAKMDVKAVQEGLENLGKVFERAAFAAETISTYLPEGEAETWRKSVGTGLARLKDSSFRSSCRDMVSHWSGLPPDAGAAREKILRSDASDFAKQYFVLTKAAGDDYVKRYWDQLGYMLLDSLVERARSDSKQYLQQFNQYLKFPLARLSETSEDLPENKIAAADSFCYRLRPARRDLGGDTLGEGAKTGNDELDEKLESLINISVPPALDCWLEQANKMLDALPTDSGEKFDCTVWLLSDTDQKELAPDGYYYIGEKGVWKHLALKQGSVSEMLGRLTIGPEHDKPLGIVQYPGEEAEFLFYRYPGDPDESPDWSLPFEGPWASLRILHKCEPARRDDDNPKKWKVWLQKKGTRQGLWLQLQFERELPRLKDWPEYDAP